MEYCFFSPSYHNDLNRPIMLRKSIKRFCDETLSHYIVVPEEDFYLFRKIFSDDKLVIIRKQNDFIKKEFYPSKLYSLINKFWHPS